MAADLTLLHCNTLLLARSWYDTNSMTAARRYSLTIHQYVVQYLYTGTPTCWQVDPAGVTSEQLAVEEVGVHALQDTRQKLPLVSQLSLQLPHAARCAHALPSACGHR